MAVTGHASWNASYDIGTPGERLARQLDLEYFAAHPKATSYVRRMIENEAGSADSETIAEWAGVEWVLVTVIGNRRDRRERSPVYPSGSVLVDGA